MASLAAVFAFLKHHFFNIGVLSFCTGTTQVEQTITYPVLSFSHEAWEPVVGKSRARAARARVKVDTLDTPQLKQWLLPPTGKGLAQFRRPVVACWTS